MLDGAIGSLALRPLPDRPALALLQTHLRRRGVPLVLLLVVQNVALPWVDIDAGPGNRPRLLSSGRRVKLNAWTLAPACSRQDKRVARFEHSLRAAGIG